MAVSLSGSGAESGKPVQKSRSRRRILYIMGSRKHALARPEQAMKFSYPNLGALMHGQAEGGRMLHVRVFASHEPGVFEAGSSPLCNGCAAKRQAPIVRGLSVLALAAGLAACGDS